MVLDKLRVDPTQFMIHDPETVVFVYEALDAAALIMMGAWMQRAAGTEPPSISDPLNNIGGIIGRIGEARQQINGGLATNDVPDALVQAQRLWNVYAVWRDNPGSVPQERVVAALDELSGAMTYLDQRTHETGTNHPRWNARTVSGQPCDCCGRR